MDIHTFGYEHDGSVVIWDTRDIWKTASTLSVTTIKVSTLKNQYSKVAKHYVEDDFARIEEADLNFPIIISKPKNSNNSLIIDGYHRIGKCLEESIKDIKVIYIEKMPRPLYCKGKPFTIEGLDFEWYNPRNIK